LGKGRNVERKVMPPEATDLKGQI